MLTLDNIAQAKNLICKHIQATPLIKSERLTHKFKRKISIKWENKHITGSFKERGACNFLLTLDQKKSQQVYAASAGNHALAVSYHSARMNIPCNIVMPLFAPLVKINTTQHYGANVILHGDTYDQAKNYAREKFAPNSSYIEIPAFDHELIISGQGTCGLELLEQMESDVDAIFVPMGGGGLLSGIAVAVKAKRPDLPIFAVQSEWTHTQRQKLACEDLFTPATIAEGIAVKTPGQLTTTIINKLVEQVLFVSEAEIADSINHMLRYEHVVCEGAGAAALALLFSDKLPTKYQHPLFIMTGSNIDLNLLGRLIERHMAQTDKLLKIRVAVPDRPGILNRVSSIVAEQHGNILRVMHDRSFSEQPGCVQVGFVIEVRNQDHAQELTNALIAVGLKPQAF